MKKVKKIRVIRFLIVAVLAVTLTTTVSAYATNCNVTAHECLNSGKLILNNGELFEIKAVSGGVYEFIHNTIETSEKNNIGNEIEKEHLQIYEKAVVESSDKAIEIINGLLSTQNKISDGWFLGSSLYMKIIANYSTKSTSYGTGYRINYVTASSTVSNGTVIDSKYLNTSAISTSEYGTAFAQTQHLNILNSSNPYTNYTMGSYPYLISGYELAANLNITAHRPNGSSYNYIVEAVIFRN